MKNTDQRNGKCATLLVPETMNLTLVREFRWRWLSLIVDVYHHNIPNRLIPPDVYKKSRKGLTPPTTPLLHPHRPLALSQFQRQYPSSNFCRRVLSNFSISIVGIQTTSIYMRMTVSCQPLTHNHRQNRKFIISRGPGRKSH